MAGLDTNSVLKSRFANGLLAQRMAAQGFIAGVEAVEPEPEVAISGGLDLIWLHGVQLPRDLLAAFKDAERQYEARIAPKPRPARPVSQIPAPVALPSIRRPAPLPRELLTVCGALAVAAVLWLLHALISTPAHGLGF